MKGFLSNHEHYWKHRDSTKPSHLIFYGSFQELNIIINYSFLFLFCAGSLNILVVVVVQLVYNLLLWVPFVGFVLYFGLPCSLWKLLWSRPPRHRANLCCSLPQLLSSSSLFSSPTELACLGIFLSKVQKTVLDLLSESICKIIYYWD